MEVVIVACYIFGAGDFFGLRKQPRKEDYVIAADGGFEACKKEKIIPDLLLGDFDSLKSVPDFPNLIRLPVEKDDTDMMVAVKKGLERGEKEFYIYGGLGGDRTDHTMANFQMLAYITRFGAHAWLYGNDEMFTAIRNESIHFPAQKDGILSVFCMGPDAEGVSIEGAHYPIENGELHWDVALGVSNHFQGQAITVEVKRGCLLLGLHTED